jgi:hypothetical protein
MNDNTSKKIEEIEIENGLDSIAKCLEGQIYMPDEKAFFYHLYTTPGPSYPLRYYDVKNPLMALRLMDVILDQYEMIFGKHTFCIIGLEVKKGFNGEWDEWEDEDGRSIKDYEYDENWILFRPIEEGEYEEGWF